MVNEGDDSHSLLNQIEKAEQVSVSNKDNLNPNNMLEVITEEGKTESSIAPQKSKLLGDAMQMLDQIAQMSR